MIIGRKNMTVGGLPMAYRLCRCGEIIYTHFDGKNTLVGVPEYFCTAESIGAEDVSKVGFSDQGILLDSTYMEQMMMLEPDICVVVSFGNEGLDAYMFDNTVRYYSRPWSEPEKRGKLITRFGDKYFRTIGYRNTKMLQLFASSGLQNLVYDTVADVVRTNDGNFKLPIKYEDLSPQSSSYAGYKDCVNGNHYAVVYVDNKPVFLDFDGTNIKLA